MPLYSKIRRLGCCVLFFIALQYGMNVINSRSAAEFTSRVVSREDWNEHWTKYRIGDGISRYPDTPGCEEFPNSVVCMYLSETDEANDIQTLVGVLDKATWLEPALDMNKIALVHVRLGDGLCAQIDPPCRGAKQTEPNCWEDDSDCWQDPNSETKQYAFSKMWYYPVLQELRDALEPDGRVLILGDKRHWTRSKDPRHGNFSVDEMYLENIAAFLGEELDIGTSQIEILDAGLPDEDFALLCSSKVFVQGGGGFSKLIAQVVIFRGGKVISPRRPLAL